MPFLQFLLLLMKTIHHLLYHILHNIANNYWLTFVHCVYSKTSNSSILFPRKKSDIGILFPFSPCISRTFTTPSFAFIYSPSFWSDTKTVPFDKKSKFSTISSSSFAISTFQNFIFFPFMAASATFPKNKKVCKKESGQPAPFNLYYVLFVKN